jgi:hypothetical protein
MSAEFAHEARVGAAGHFRAAFSRERLVLALGPAVSVAGIVWAVIQPWRITFFDLHAQSFWWAVSQPPLYVVLVGLLFRFFIAPGLVRDLKERLR